MKRYMVLSLLFCAPLNAMSLFRAYPILERTIPIERIAKLPTPITECKNLEQTLHHPHIYVKDDGLTGTDGSYGGNKVRKLEFLLGDAKNHNAKTVVTYGCFGTNHGLATACYAKKLGFECILMLKPQPNTYIVRNNLLLDHYFGAKIEIFPDNETRDRARDQFLKEHPNAYFFPTGGSIPLGALGFVNAAFELKEQITAGLIPEPDYIYVALGSAGTTAGLLLGLKLAGIQSKICAIAVEPEDMPHEFEEHIYNLFIGTNALLHTHDAAIPLVEFPYDQIIINKTLMGPGYGVWIPEGDHATRIMRENEMIELEGTYSAKAMAAIMADIKNGVRTQDEVILFWNSYCGLDFSHLTRQVNYKDLNPELHPLFEPTFSGHSEEIPYDIQQKMIGISWKPECPVPLRDLRYLTLTHWGYDHEVHIGHMVVHANIADEMLAIFSELFDEHFPIERMELIDAYDADDDKSMAANNSSAFCCRDITNQPGKFSLHSYGIAIDINPLINPYVKGEQVLPEKGKAYLDRTKTHPGMIVSSQDNACYRIFTKYGYEWGGNWQTRQDYQHFQKCLKSVL